MTNVVGVPTDIKDNENRVALQPDGVAELVHAGHEVLVQAGAGDGSRFTDQEFAAAGARVVDSADEVSPELLRTRAPIIDFFGMHIGIVDRNASSGVSAWSAGGGDGRVAGSVSKP